MNFAAWAARTGIAHGPEIFFQAGDGDDSVCWNPLLEPETLGFFIDTEMVARDLRASEDGDIDCFFRWHTNPGTSPISPRKRVVSSLDNCRIRQIQPSSCTVEC